ncbi:MAG: GWxTD domain-containing protein [Gemmatimonadota bacterium]|nr:GWxTD domain-containing protein [Gemmatimonadota bacterium]
MRGAVLPLLLAATAFARAASAQGSAAPLVALSEAAVARGDSAAALSLLDSAVRIDRSNAGAWHRRGVIALAKARPGGRAKLMPPDEISLLRMADSSLRLAARLAPDSGRFALDLGRYFLFADFITLRAQAPGRFAHALEMATRANDRPLEAEAADELGMVAWRRYEAVANRRQLQSTSMVMFDALLSERHGAKNFLENFTREPAEKPGQLDYLRASELFARAAGADANYERAIRHGFMALAEQGRWEEMRRTAERRSEAAPHDASAWLARGLASHELNDDRNAAPAFDSALALLPAGERSRYTNLSRILRAEDSSAFMALPPSQRDEAARVYWTVSDPLTLTPENEHRLEFLARVAYAELRWTSDDFDLHGADTDRGQIWVRYGPPPIIASFGPDVEQVTSLLSGETSEIGVGSILWYYPVGNFHFLFRAPPSYGVATFLRDYRQIAREIRARAPVGWSNLRIDREMDSIDVQLARFRGGVDSVDLAVYADVPIARMVHGVDIARGAVDLAFTAFDSRARPLARDSTRQTVSFVHPESASRRSWRRRFGPGSIFYRVEARQPDAERAARATGALELGAARGFGISDVVMAERVSPKNDAPRRWSDFLITPSATTLRRGQSLALLWESYELEPKPGGGSNSYKIEIVLTVVAVSRPSSFVARIIGGAADAIGTSAKGDQQVALSYTTQKPARAVQVDHLTLELGDAPAGEYRLTLRITDLVTGRTGTTIRRLSVAE